MEEKKNGSDIVYTLEEVGKQKEKVRRCGFPDGEILEEEYQKKKERSGISVCFSKNRRV